MSGLESPSQNPRSESMETTCVNNATDTEREGGIEKVRRAVRDACRSLQSCSLAAPAAASPPSSAPAEAETTATSSASLADALLALEALLALTSGLGSAPLPADPVRGKAECGSVPGDSVVSHSRPLPHDQEARSYYFVEHHYFLVIEHLVHAIVQRPELHRESARAVWNRFFVEYPLSHVVIALAAALSALPSLPSPPRHLALRGTQREAHSNAARLILDLTRTAVLHSGDALFDSLLALQLSSKSSLFSTSTRVPVRACAHADALLPPASSSSSPSASASATVPLRVTPLCSAAIDAVGSIPDRVCNLTHGRAPKPLRHRYGYCGCVNWFVCGALCVMCAHGRCVCLCVCVCVYCMYVLSDVKAYVCIFVYYYSCC